MTKISENNVQGFAVWYCRV